MVFENIDFESIYNDLVRLSEIKNDERLLVCIDEIQNLPDITKVIKYLIDHFSVKFVVTGSSNYYLRNLFPESLSGRKFLYVLPVLSFREFLFFNGRISEDQLKGDLDKAMQTKSQVNILQTKELYADYLEFGGFPEVVLTTDRDTKRLILRNVFSSFFEKDIRVFSELKDVRELRDLILLLAVRNGNILDVSKLSSELGINRVKMYNYLEFLESIFFLRLLPKYSKSIDRSVSGGKKVYFSDTGILNLVAKITDGQLFETAVANQLAYYGELSFYNKRNKSEIDFILNKEIAFEVKQKALEPDYKKLQNLAVELGITRQYVISNTLSNVGNTVYPWFL
jgi:predicted AAA+ superfamily ATPase